MDNEVLKQIGTGFIVLGEINHFGEIEHHVECTYCGNQTWVGDINKLISTNCDYCGILWVNS